MLVLNVLKDERVRRKSVFSKKIVKSLPRRSNCCIGNKVYTIVDLSEADLGDVFVQKLLKINRHKVLKCNNKDINERISEYLLDIRPYIKRAILSSVVNEIKEASRFDSICVKDSLFNDCEEYYVLAGLSRKISVVCNENKEINIFRNKCYNNLGLHVDNHNSDAYKAFLDLDNIIMNKSSFLTIDGCEMLVYADESYFNVDENVGELLKFNVPKEYACASVYM